MKEFKKEKDIVAKVMGYEEWLSWPEIHEKLISDEKGGDDRAKTATLLLQVVPTFMIISLVGSCSKLRERCTKETLRDIVQEIYENGLARKEDLGDYVNVPPLGKFFEDWV